MQAQGNYKMSGLGCDSLMGGIKTVTSEPWKSFVASVLQQKYFSWKQHNQIHNIIYSLQFWITNLKKKSVSFNMTLTAKLNACVCYFLTNFYLSPNNSPSKTMKDVFYFI